MSEPRFFIISGGHKTAEDFFDVVEWKHGKVVGASLHAPPARHEAVYGIVEFEPHPTDIVLCNKRHVVLNDGWWHCLAAMNHEGECSRDPTDASRELAKRIFRHQASK